MSPVKAECHVVVTGVLATPGAPVSVLTLEISFGTCDQAGVPFRFGALQDRRGVCGAGVLRKKHQAVGAHVQWVAAE